MGSRARHLQYREADASRNIAISDAKANSRRLPTLRTVGMYPPIAICCSLTLGPKRSVANG